MGQAVDAYMAYGFAVYGEGTPEVLEEYSPYGEGANKMSELLDMGFYGWGDIWTPVIYVKSSQIWAMDGVPKEVPGELRLKTPDEVHAIHETWEHVLKLLKDAGEYDEDYGPKLGEIGWLVWGHYG